MSEECDVIVIGAGIAGASVAALLAATHRVRLVEMEDRPAYHTTGRSAALYEPNYGPPVIRALTLASKPWFDSPPDGFANAPILSARPTLFLSTRAERELEAKFLVDVEGVEPLEFADAQALCPILRPDEIDKCFIDGATADIDVDLLHQGFLRRMRQAGGELVTGAEVTSIEHRDGRWRCATPKGGFAAPIIVNAAGAWGDVVAARAGLGAVGLVPKRRSVALVPGPEGMDVREWPAVCDVAETFYFKPTGGVLLVSPSEATPVEPHDAFADDMALAEGIERFQACTTFEVTRLQSTWGGLRTFSPDGAPVVGYDGRVPGFFWLVGQGGYGIQTSPALSGVAAALVRGEPVPQRWGLTESRLEELSPRRFVL